MLHTLLLASGLALAGVQPTSDDPVHAETTIELTVSDDDTVSGTATFHLALDEGRWETDRFGPPSDAAPSYESSTEDLERLDTQLAGHAGVTVERAERDDDPLGHSGVMVRFDTVPFERFNAVVALLHDDGHVGTVLLVSRQSGQGHPPEGGGPHHRLNEEVNSACTETTRPRSHLTREESCSPGAAARILPIEITRGAPWAPQRPNRRSRRPRTPAPPAPHRPRTRTARTHPGPGRRAAGRSSSRADGSNTSTPRRRDSSASPHADRPAERRGRGSRAARNPSRPSEGPWSSGVPE